MSWFYPSSFLQCELAWLHCVMCLTTMSFLLHLSHWVPDNLPTASITIGSIHSNKLLSNYYIFKSQYLLWECIVFTELHFPYVASETIS
ncbi:hypothetical protein BJV82DRAFT_365053 [Fennellomyces sp. T-0311]|nr:hypothetical protein BJV82DRAFT_365053 [Fennellomyces sp. T-0311]